MPLDYEDEENTGNSIARPRSQKSPNPVEDLNDTFFNLTEQSEADSSYWSDSQTKPYNPDPLVRQSNDYTIYEDMTRDDQVSIALQVKKDLVVGAGSEIVANSDDEQAHEIKEFLEQALYKDAEIPLDDSLEEILSAYEFGFSVSEKVFKKRDDGKYTLRFIKTRHPVTWLIHTDEKGNVTKYEQRASSNTLFIDPNAIIHYATNAQFGNPYGTSDLKAAYAAYFVKRNVIKYYAIFLEKSASPIPVARYQKDAPQAAVDAIFNAMKSFQQKTALAIPKDIEVEFLKSENNGDAYRRAIDMFNTFIGRALFIPDLLGFQGSETSGGSYSLGKEQMDVLYKHINKRRAELEKLINKHIIKPLVYINFGDVEECPEWRLKPIRESEMVELAKLWLEAARSNVVTPSLEQLNYFNKLCKFPELSEEDMEMMQIKGIEEGDESGMPMDEEQKSKPGKCGAGMIEDPVTGECIPEEDTPNVTDEPKEKPRKCPEGQRFDPRSGKCIQIGKLSKELEKGQSTECSCKELSLEEEEKSQYQNQTPCDCKKKEFKSKQLPYDKDVDFQALEKSLDSYVDIAKAEMTPIIKRSIADLKAQLKRKKIIETKNLDKVETLKMKYQSEMVSVFTKIFKDQSKDARTLAALELIKSPDKKEFAVDLEDDELAKLLESETWQTIGDWEYKFKKDIRTELAAAIKEGLPLSSVLEKVDEMELELNQVQVDRFARTKTTEVMNRSRKSYFDNTGVVAAYMYSAIMDGRTSQICQGLNGKVFEKSKAPIPPLHFNCRSVLVPITKYEEWKADEKVGNQDIDKFIDDNKGKGFPS